MRKDAAGIIFAVAGAVCAQSLPDPVDVLARARWFPRKKELVTNLHLRATRRRSAARLRVKLDNHRRPAKIVESSEIPTSPATLYSRTYANDEKTDYPISYAVFCLKKSTRH